MGLDTFPVRPYHIYRKIKARTYFRGKRQWQEPLRSTSTLCQHKRVADTADGKNNVRSFNIRNSVLEKAAAAQPERDTVREKTNLNALEKKEPPKKE